MYLNFSRSRCSWKCIRLSITYIYIHKYIHLQSGCIILSFQQQCMSVLVAPYCCLGILNYFDVSHSNSMWFYLCGLLKFNLFKLKKTLTKTVHPFLPLTPLPLPLATINLISVSMSLVFKFLKICFLDSTYKRDFAVLVFLCLTYVT